MLPLVPNTAFGSCENHHPTLNFSQAKRFCSTYFKVCGCMKQESGFTALYFCDDCVKTTVVIQVLVGKAAENFEFKSASNAEALILDHVFFCWFTKKF